MDTLFKFTEDLINREGIFFSAEESNISYPEDANEHFFRIEEESFWFKHRNKCIINTVKRYAPHKVFFDIGGGNGYVAKGLEENGIEVVLIEPGIRGCMNARKRGLTTVVCSTLENAGFKQGNIPAVGLFDVIEHINDDLNFLKQINGFLEDDGHLFITVPAYQPLWSNEDIDAGHYKRYTLKDLSVVLQQAGYTIEYSTYIFSILPIPIFFFRTIPSKIGLNKNSGDYKKHMKEHRPKKKILDKLMDNIWHYELGRIQRAQRIPFGSCLVVARKNKI